MIPERAQADHETAEPLDLRVERLAARGIGRLREHPGGLDLRLGVLERVAERALGIVEQLGAPIGNSARRLGFQVSFSPESVECQSASPGRPASGALAGTFSVSPWL